MRKALLIMFVWTLGGIINCSLLMSQTPSYLGYEPKKMPKVFTIGQQEILYESLVGEYKLSLLEACDNQIMEGYGKWKSFLKEMEAYSKLIGFDLNGSKMWIHIFCEPDGTFTNIGYHLKPSSINLNLEEMDAFLNGFMDHYKFPLITADQKYAHYSMAAFPILED